MIDFPKNFKVRVTPHAKQNKVVECDGVLRVYTTTAPDKGRANETVIELLSEYFDIPKSRIKILNGLTFREKTIAII